MRIAVALSLSLAACALLAPACASLGMFRRYAERRQVFKGEVMRLMEGDTPRER